MAKNYEKLQFFNFDTRFIYSLISLKTSTRKADTYFHTCESSVFVENSSYLMYK